MTNNAFRNNKGFTLVEMAIVLVIIGLILGSVLKGQELIKNAKYKRLYSQSREMTAAVYTYYDKYQKFPGDDSVAATRWTTTSGNGNGYIDGGTTWCAAATTGENCFALEHLRLAGIISGSGTLAPNHSFGGRIAIVRPDAVITGWTKPYAVCFEWLSNETARWLDSNYDDGVYNTGTIRGNADYTSGSADAVAAQFVCVEG